MTFLSPLFLIGAAAAAIPIALHLLKREPEARVQFALALDASGANAAAMDQMGFVLQQDPDNADAEAYVRQHEARAIRYGTNG